MRPWPFFPVPAPATSGGGSSQGGSVAEGDGDVAMQLRLARLHDEQVVALSVTHMAADLALGEDRRDCQEACGQGHSEAAGGGLWRSRRAHWTSCFRDVTPSRFSPRTVCSMS